MKVLVKRKYLNAIPKPKGMKLCCLSMGRTARWEFVNENLADIVAEFSFAYFQIKLQ
jgi:hypothetical protein